MRGRPPANPKAPNPPHQDRVQLWPVYAIRRDENGRFLAVSPIEIHGTRHPERPDSFEIEVAGHSIEIAIGSHRTAESFTETKLVLMSFAMIVDTGVLYKVKRRLARAVIPEALYENLGTGASNVNRGPPDLESAVLARIPQSKKRAPKPPKTSSQRRSKRLGRVDVG